MSKVTRIVLSTLALFTSSIAFADTCEPIHMDHSFRQVVLGLHGRVVRCDYGKEFDFKHSYTLQGNYVPASGPWEGSSEPYTIFCRDGNSVCVFKLK